jgi:GAF domain-containing protein
VSTALMQPDVTALTNLLAQVTGTGRGAALLVRDGDVLRPKVSHGLPMSFVAELRVPVQAGAGANGTAAALGQPVVVRDTRAHPATLRYFTLLTKHRLFSIYSLPIFAADGMVIATLALYGREPGVPTPDEVAAMQKAADAAAAFLGA